MTQGKKAAAKAIGIIERREQAIQFRRAGLSIRAIALRLDVDPSTIHSDIKVMLAESIKENVNNADQMRVLELERLDDMLLRITPQISNGHLGAIAQAIRISERRAKLLGLDMPIKQEIAVHHTWQDDTIQLIKSGHLTYTAALETFDHDDTLVRSLFAKAEIPISIGEDQG